MPPRRARARGSRRCVRGAVEHRARAAAAKGLLLTDRAHWRARVIHLEPGLVDRDRCLVRHELSEAPRVSIEAVAAGASAGRERSGLWATASAIGGVLCRRTRLLVEGRARARVRASAAAGEWDRLRQALFRGRGCSGFLVLEPLPLQRAAASTRACPRATPARCRETQAVQGNQLFGLKLEMYMPRRKRGGSDGRSLCGRVISASLVRRTHHFSCSTAFPRLLHEPYTDCPSMRSSATRRLSSTFRLKSPRRQACRIASQLGNCAGSDTAAISLLRALSFS